MKAASIVSGLQKVAEEVQTFTKKHDVATELVGGAVAAVAANSVLKAIGGDGVGEKIASAAIGVGAGMLIKSFLDHQASPSAKLANDQPAAPALHTPKPS
jgi:hypothetical protein